MRFIFEELPVSTKRPFTVKATLSEEEKKTLVAFSKKAQMSEAELIRYFLRPDDAVTRWVNLAEDEERTEMIRIRVSPSEKKSIGNRASELGGRCRPSCVAPLLSGESRKSMSIGRRSTRSTTSC